MTYDEIYSLFYSKITDPTFFEKYSKDEAYELMKNWMHSIVSIPYIRKCFSTITLDDEVLEMKFVLKKSIDEDSDNYYVKDIFSQGSKTVNKCFAWNTQPHNSRLDHRKPWGTLLYLKSNVFFPRSF